MIPEHHQENFHANGPVCLRCEFYRADNGTCMHDEIEAKHHANSGFCPIGKYRKNGRIPDGWDELEKIATGIPFTPRTQPQEIVSLLSVDHPQAGKWSRWKNVKEAYRIAVRTACENIPEYPGGSGRGIVIVAGGRYWAQGIISIQILRHIGIDLPIEMWHLPGEISERQRKYTEAMGIKLCEGNARGGWELKLYAMAHSGFEELLFLDADSFPTRPVDDFWKCEGYQRTGFLIFPDRPCPLEPVYHPGDRLKPEVYEAFDLPYVDERTKESGQMFVNRAKVWPMLWLANWMAERSAYTFQYLWGDKDLTTLAAAKLNMPIYVMPTYWDHLDPALIHFDWQDKVCWVHRCHGKADLYNQGFTTTDQRQDRNDKLPHEALFWELFAKLKKDMADDVRDYRRLHPKITAVTVCIGYSEYLRRTIDANRRHFDDWIIVTEAADEETRALCQEKGLRVVLSERKHDNGSSFNMGALRNDGMSVVESDWICLVDADVILPLDLRQKLPALNESKIYGIDRKGNSQEWNDSAISGFFQLFHSSQNRKYREDFPDAGFSDTAFRDLWPTSDRIVIDGVTARHLGTTAADWKGVAVKKFDGAAVWAELESLPFLPDLSLVPQRIQEIVAKLPRFSCRCRKDAKAYLRDHLLDFSSPLALAKYIWRWHNHINRKLRKPEMAWSEASRRTGWDRLEASAIAA